MEARLRARGLENLRDALILGEDSETGDYAGTKLTAEDVAKAIRFFGREERMPEPAIRVIGVW